MSFPQDTGTGVRNRALVFPVEAILDFMEASMKMGYQTKKQIASGGKAPPSQQL